MAEIIAVCVAVGEEIGGVLRPPVDLTAVLGVGAAFHAVGSLGNLHIVVDASHVCAQFIAPRVGQLRRTLAVGLPRRADVVGVAKE